MYRIKLILSFLISWIPLNFLRIVFYRVIGYKIGKNVRIGFRTVIISNNCRIGNNARIGIKNYIKSKTFTIGERSNIGMNNKIVAWADYSQQHPNSNRVKIGVDCRITEGHLLDGTFGMFIGNESWIAGRNSSLWSHGATKKQDSIIIGKRCYLGSDVKIATGVKVGDDVLVAMGSIVLKGCPSKCTIAGNPASLIKSDYLWHENWS